jgi:hypothetical protein
MLKKDLISSALYIIPAIIIAFSLIFLGIMYKKEKNFSFYVINIFIYLIIIIINAYISTFLTTMENVVVSIKIVKLAHDLILINMIIEIVSFVFLLIRGFGLNFKKFNFDSDIAKLNINESDKEEIELSLNIDLDFVKSKRKRKLRYFKYVYKENKFLVNLSIILTLIIIFITTLFLYFYKTEKKVEGVVYPMNRFNLRVNKSMFLNYDINSEKITDNYLVVVDASLQTNNKSTSLFLKDFSLEVGEAIFHVDMRYSNRVIDIGSVYNQEILNSEYTDYIFIFEIPEKYINSDIFFVYNNEGLKTKINLKPRNYVTNKIAQTHKLDEIMSFKDTLGDISFTINSFEIKNRFLINYNFCIKNNECFLSKEYITPTINENFDKHILKLNVNYSNKSNLNINTFYDFFSKFGVIEYKIGEKLYNQNSNFEELKSKKIDNKNNVYIGINSNISQADSINLIFNIRDSKYVYTLK